MNKKFTNFFKNPMVFIVLIFVIWMIFFDTNSLIIHNELSNDINKLNNQKNILQTKLIKISQNLNYCKQTQVSKNMRERKTFYEKRK